MESLKTVIFVGVRQKVYENTCVSAMKTPVLPGHKAILELS
jgi:hypothetical protein